MRVRKELLAGITVATVVGAGAAHAVGPWPGLAASVTSPSGTLRYTAKRFGGATTVRARRIVDGRLVRSASFSGNYGIPAVTSTGVAGGFSPDGSLLVLGEEPGFQSLRRSSRFLVLSLPQLRLERTIVLGGEFGFDAISPDNRTLYVIQHASREDLVRYVVRGYDLRTNRLLRRAIVDKGEPDEVMRGYAIARATSPSADWVYTLYTRGGGKPFIHALGTNKRIAHCIDLTWDPGRQNVWLMRLQLTSGGKELVVRSPSGAVVATVDTTTFRVR